MEGKRFLLCTSVIVLIVAVLQSDFVQSQTSSTYGKEFYIGFMSSTGGTVFTSLRLVVGTPANSADFVVESSAGVIHTGRVSHDSPVVINIPPNYQVKNHYHFNREKGVHIYSTAEEPIFVIVETYISILNHGAYVAYPCTKFDNQTMYEYYVISTGVPNNYFVSEFLLVGCENDTIITITPSKTVLLPDDLQRLNSSTISVGSGSTSHQMVLHKMQTLAVLNSDDLTGTRIRSNKPLTVISGHECANIPQSASGCEPVAVQIPPVATWGTSFLLAPFAGRSSNQTFKAISSEKNASFISICGGNITQTLQNASIFIVSTDKYCYMESTAPMLVIQLSTGFATDSKGDPAIAMISPVDQYIHDINFISLPTSFFPTSFVSITVATEHFNPNSILLDGITINCEWQEIYDIDKNVTGYGCSKAILGETSGPTQHNVSHSNPDGVLSALVYGFKSAGPARGYAYLAGQKLKLSKTSKPTDGVLIDLKKFPGVMELERVIDAYSYPINIPGGLIFGHEIVTTAYVNENGVISFEQPWQYPYPDRFPTEYYWSRQGLAVAPFWNDNDIRKAGAVRYVAYGLQIGDTTSRGKKLLDQVNKRIREVDEDFSGKWLLIAHWDHVHPSPHGDDNHRGILESELEKTNNYQAIIVTNFTHTYALFTYLCGEMQWSSVGENKAAVIGFSAKGEFFNNHPQSGTENAASAVSCTKLGRRTRRFLDPNDDICGLPADGCDMLPEPFSQICYCRTRLENDAAFNVDEVVNQLDPCPDTLDKARADTGRFVNQIGTSCYVSGRTVVINATSFTQQCCYNGGSLITVHQVGLLAGSLLIQHPIYNPDGYEMGDKFLKEKCCHPTLLATDAGYCQDFTRRRPTNDGTSYESPDLAIGAGDPHYMTFDGNGNYHRWFTFNGKGDFVLMEALDESDTPVFTLQGRLDTISPWSITTHQALAFGHSNSAFHFGLNNGFSVFKTKPGPPINITEQLENRKPWFEPATQTMLLRENNQLTASFYKWGIVLIVNILPASAGDSYMNFEMQVPKIFAGKLRGFLGNLDDNFSNDLHRRGDPTPLPSLSDHDILEPLKTWNASKMESLFRDPVCPDERKRRQTDEYVPVFFNQLTFTNEQIAACEGNKPCLFDLAVTNDTKIAANTKEAEEIANATIDILNNFPPNISAEKVLRVNIGEEIFYNLTVYDSGDEVTLSVLGGLPQGSTLEEIEGEYVFRWTLQEVTTKSLIFIANDSAGASSMFAPIVHICACVNGGICTLSGPVSGSTTIIMNCNCNEAFSGQFCEEDRNGCSEIQCFEGVECMDVPAPGTGAVCGACPLGYTGDGLNKCYDIDECLNATICEQTCTNTDGSFKCGCLPGYRLTEQTNHCQDINECNEVNDCQQICMNTDGSYSCSCNEGFSLADDGRTCIANEPCGGECSYGCAVISGKEECYCPIGFTLSEGTNCVDEDECLHHPCSHLCSNTNGSYECFCMSGFELQEDGHTCEDIDECLEAALNSENMCDINAQCINKNGSFECPCVPGYEVVNSTCQRVQNEAQPPPPPSAVPLKGTENSVNYSLSTLTPETFTPTKQQMFKEITVNIINNFCSMNVCHILLFNGNIRSESNLKVEPLNIAIPASLIIKGNEGLQLTLYVQLPDGFLSRQLLKYAIEQGEDQYRDSFFPSTTTAMPTTTATEILTTTEAPTTTEIPTTSTTTTEAPTTTEIPTTPSTTVSTTAPAEQSCVAAGFVGCCTPENDPKCQRQGCWCDVVCFNYNDCCEDIGDTGCHV